MAEITIKTVQLSKIQLNLENPRTITGPALDKLIKSLKDFPEMMELREIVVDETMMVLGGNMRLLALQKSGAKKCIAKIVKGLTDDQKREFMVKDNAPAGEWDFDALANTWSELPLTEWGIDLPKHYLNNDQLGQEIITEEERSEAGRTADEAAKAITAKIKKICEENPQKVNSAMAVIVNNGRGNAVLFLADPNTADIVQELKRYADAGEHSPLECLMRSLIENNA